MQHVFAQLGPPHPSSPAVAPLPRAASPTAAYAAAPCACAWTPLVTTWQHAHALGCCVLVAGLLKGQQPASAAKLEPQSSSTSCFDLDVEPGRLDERRIEVIANGLPLWNGAQVAADRSRLLVFRAASEAALLEHPPGCPSCQGAGVPGARCLPAIPSHSPWHRSRWPVELRSIHLRTLPRSRCASLFSCSLRLRPRTSLVGRVVHRSRPCLCCSLLGLSLAGAGNVDGNLPLMSDLLADSSEVPPLASRMP